MFESILAEENVLSLPQMGHGKSLESSKPPAPSMSFDNVGRGKLLRCCDVDCIVLIEKVFDEFADTLNNKFNISRCNFVRRSDDMVIAPHAISRAGPWIDVYTVGFLESLLNR